MRRLLQRIDSGLYYQGPGVWTNNPDHAFAFHKTSSALECCLRENLPPMQLVLKFEDSIFDVRVPCWNPDNLGSLAPGQPQEPPSTYPDEHRVHRAPEAALSLSRRHKAE